MRNKSVHYWINVLQIHKFKKITTSDHLSLRERRVIPLTKNVDSWTWRDVSVGEAYIHFAGQRCVFFPVLVRDSEIFTGWMRAWAFRKINKLFTRDVSVVGLKGDVNITGGKLCDDTFDHSSVSLQYIWEKSPDLHWWTCNFSFWRIMTGNKAMLVFLDLSLSKHSWFIFCLFLLLETTMVSSADGKHLCSALHLRSFIFFHWRKETVRMLIIWVEFVAWFTWLLEWGLLSNSQVTLASKTVWTTQVAFTSAAAIIAVLKLGISTWM